jgi:hypothetical protein
MRLQGITNLSVKDIHSYVTRRESLLGFDDAKNIFQADRCMMFIESIRRHRLVMKSENWIVSLIFLLPYNMMEESFLRSEFGKEMAKLNKIITENVEQDKPIFTAAKAVLDFIMYSRLVKENALPAVFLIANLLIVHSGKLLVMEDTDSISPDILLEITMEINRNV